MKIPVVDLSECILCGVCQDVCPQIFQLNDAGYVEVAECSDYPEPEVDEAIRNCPTDCISREDTKEAYDNDKKGSPVCF